jgi:DNA-binding transcriptional LysR family regulator
MELRQLRYFVAIAEAGSFAAGSQRLFIAQPALSVQMRQLEEDIGEPLLLRHRRGITLTPAGQRLLGDARALLSQAQASLQRAREHGAATHLLRLGLVPSATQTLLPGLARALRGSHPLLLIEAREMSTQAQLDGLREGRLDFALGRPARSDRSIATLLTHEDPYCLALPADHRLARKGRLSLSDVAHDSFISFGRDHGANYFDRTIAMCVAAGFSPAIRHEANTFWSALGMVAAGLGVSIIPASCALLEQRGVVLRRLPASKHRSTLALLAPAARAHSLHDEVRSLVAAQVVALQRQVKAALN